ncbi:cobalamin-5'-phosphate synthase [Roseinatronobacter thiooxidans]|uniref:Adenosylcobinamide-GDP ribazoletransferase n=1 Tax=Roseinatronobacter thiooxidans TaxID=121821 RepID=A0A2W7QUS8_9RHOB|nr:adenosylcobinamide-GDP ribazoletransferase [Roseinatronobacter thiooxidans]PZX42175.1 cobalamin-5'-phosphate synthase [Roseinatronobacter thiooxidans]
MIRTALAQIQLAFMVLTRLPAGQLPDPAPRIGAAAWAFPLAGLAVGLGTALVFWGTVALGLPLGLAALLALGAQIALCGGLHEDGLADLADGLWGGHTPARRLEIMRDSRIGSYGVLALILSLALRWQALVYLGALDLTLALLALVGLAMLSRVAPVAMLAYLPPARADGLGHSAQSVGWRSVAVAALVALVPLVLAQIVPLWAVALVIAAQGLVVLALARTARRKIGGQTGDVLGAGQQLAEIAGYLALCAYLGA